MWIYSIFVGFWRGVLGSSGMLGFELRREMEGGGVVWGYFDLRCWVRLKGCRRGCIVREGELG